MKLEIIPVCLVCMSAVVINPAFSSSNGTGGTDVTRKFGSMTIRVDPRIELLSAAQLLCDSYRGPSGKLIMGNLESNYRREVLEYFARFKDHPVISLTGEMSQHAFWFGHPIKGVLCRGSLPEFVPRYQPEELVLRLAGGQENFDKYYAALADFARQSSFSDFFSSHEQQYIRMIETFDSKERRDYPVDLEKFFGTTQREYNLIVSPLNEYCGYGQRIMTGDQQYSTFVVVGPIRITSDSLPDFNWDNHNLFWHEFSHPHVNHLVAANIGRLLGPCTPLQPVTPEEVAQFGIAWEVQVGDWVGEHIVRATEACMMTSHTPEKDLDEFFRKQRKDGFSYVAEVYQALQRYACDRGRYPRLEDFFPELIAVFERIGAVAPAQGK